MKRFRSARSYPNQTVKEVLVSKVFNEKTGSNDYRTTVVVNSRRGKVRAISECVYDFLKNEEARCEAGLISEKTVKNKREVLTKQFLNYLEDKKVYGTNQISARDIQKIIQSGERQSYQHESKS